MSRAVGVVFLVVGLVVLALAYSGSQSFADQTKHVFTGEFRDRTTIMFVAGAASAAIGLVALLIPSRRLGYGS